MTEGQRGLAESTSTCAPPVRWPSLPPWYDVDNGQDLERLRRELATLPPEIASNTRSLLLSGS